MHRHLVEMTNAPSVNGLRPKRPAANGQAIQITQDALTTRGSREPKDNK
jgi:hypothetical protein